uniref:Leucine-rich repeat receptor-like protein kinase PEPR2 n=1 Tax=Nicotiana tabacum TaxID=4097 RepID=A0A1S3ZFR0_TOBAC
MKTQPFEGDNSEQLPSEISYQSLEPTSKSVSNLPSSALEGPKLVYKSSKRVATPMILTCEDLEHTMLSEFSEKKSNSQPQGWSTKRTKTEKPVNVDSQAYQTGADLGCNIRVLENLENLQFSSTEQSILQSLKQHWRDSEFLHSWDLNSSACNWSGVSCVNGKVTELNLGEKNITGIIPSTFCQLKNLTLIDLSNNNISGTIPASLKDCSKLQHLDLSNNYLRDQFP